MYIFMMFNAEQQGCSSLVIMASSLYGILTKLWRKAVFVLKAYSSVCRTFEYSKVSVRVIIKSGHYWLTSPHSHIFSALTDDNMQWSDLKSIFASYCHLGLYKFIEKLCTEQERQSAIFPCSREHLIPDPPLAHSLLDPVNDPQL